MYICRRYFTQIITARNRHTFLIKMSSLLKSRVKLSFQVYYFAYFLQFTDLFWYSKSKEQKIKMRTINNKYFLCIRKVCITFAPAKQEKWRDSSAGQSVGFIIRRSWVRVPPPLQIMPCKSLIYRTFCFYKGQLRDKLQHIPHFWGLKASSIQIQKKDGLPNR